jgi:hypothetical protein
MRSGFEEKGRSLSNKTRSPHEKGRSRIIWQGDRLLMEKRGDRSWLSDRSFQRGDRFLGWRGDRSWESGDTIALWFGDAIDFWGRSRVIAYTGISYSANAMTQSNDLSQRVDRTEGQIVDLQMTANLILQAIDKNSEDIAQLIEVSRRNSEGVSGLLELTRRNTDTIAALQASQARTDEAIQGIYASIERMDRLFDYLIRCDQE